jgi:hypothetical protein
LENLNDSKDTNRTWANNEDNIKSSAKNSLSLYELKQHKPWFDDECLQFSEQRKQAKMQWLQDPNQSIIIIIIFFHGFGWLTCSSIDALPSFPGASMIFSPSRFVVEGVFQKSGVVHSFKVLDPVLFVFGSRGLYSRDL